MEHTPVAAKTRPVDVLDVNADHNRLVEVAASSSDPATLLALTSLHSTDRDVLAAIAGNAGAKPGARERAAELLARVDAGGAP